MIKSKVKAVQASGTWDSPNGMLYKFEYTMEDGTTLTAQHKEPSNVFQPDTEVEYEVKGENSYGKYGKVSKPQEQPFVQGGGSTKNNTSDSILYQVCLKGVMDYKIQHGHQYFTAEDINNLALDIARVAKQNIEKL